MFDPNRVLVASQKAVVNTTDIKKGGDYAYNFHRISVVQANGERFREFRAKQSVELDSNTLSYEEDCF